MTHLTLEEIGKLAGVSRSTVSRVINGHDGVRADVRKRVLAVVDETGYQPNLAARSLAARRSNIIGLVIPRSVQILFTDPYFPRLIQGISQVCNKYDYTLSLFVFSTEDEEEKLYPRVLRSGLIDGVIIQASQIGDPLIPQLIDNNVPFVVVGRPDGVPQASFVDVDNVVGAYSAVGHLIQHGYQRIGTITGPLLSTAAIDRREGYLTALNDRGLVPDPELMVEGDFTENGGYLGMQQLLVHRPDAVFVASDTMAFGALRALREAGITIPDDLALIGFDDLPPAQISNPPLTTMRQPIRRTGAVAVETLIDILNNGSQPPRHIMLGTQLVIRQTCCRSVS